MYGIKAFKTSKDSPHCMSMRCIKHQSFIRSCFRLSVVEFWLASSSFSEAAGLCMQIQFCDRLISSRLQLRAKHSSSGRYAPSFRGASSLQLRSSCFRKQFSLMNVQSLSTAAAEKLVPTKTKFRKYEFVSKPSKSSSKSLRLTLHLMILSSQSQFGKLLKRIRSSRDIESAPNSQRIITKDIKC